MRPRASRTVPCTVSVASRIARDTARARHTGQEVNERLINGNGVELPWNAQVVDVKVAALEEDRHTNVGDALPREQIHQRVWDLRSHSAAKTADVQR